MTTWSYSLEESSGVVRAHRIDCPTVRMFANAGEPVISLFECKEPLPRDIQRHYCLDDEEKE